MGRPTVASPLAIAVTVLALATGASESPTEMLDGIYAGLTTGLHLSAAGTVDQDVSMTYVTFYPDGSVYRRVPEGGFEGWDRAAAQRQSPALWGTYKQVAPGRWQIAWNDSGRIGIVERDGQGLTYEDGSVFPVATCEGLSLEGLYLQPGSLQSEYPPDWIAFLETGDFLDNGLVGAVAYQNIAMSNPRTISGGQGKYRIGRNTLYLDYQDGRRIQVEFHAQSGDTAKRPIPTIYINGTALTLAR